MNKMTASALRATPQDFAHAGEIRELRNYFRVEEYPSGSVIYRAGDMANRAYLLRSGRVKLYRPRSISMPLDAHEPLLSLLAVGDLFGELLRPPGAAMEETAVTQGTTEVWSIEGRDVGALVEARPALGMEIIKALNARNRSLRKRTAGLTFKEVPARLAEQIITLVDSHGERCLHGAEADLRGVTQQDLADLVGASRSFVSTLINEMKRDGMLGSAGRTLCVRDRRALQRLASADRL